MTAIVDDIGTVPATRTRAIGASVGGTALEWFEGCAKPLMRTCASRSGQPQNDQWRSHSVKNRRKPS
ncbi:hypothetical protein [Bosea sp. BK604]|uniref:hypothetical protein n=1 Tax=Bosea sp. BK604 TaxID=2512180 RepID=UPI00104990D2|nr:hypothetical protein [Bosea sp. BK604]TCR65508.1 hypothetical protein EV560_105271 [Bosea sp. BK604]